jgi:hypothetical protein
MDAGQEDCLSQACGELFLAEVDADPVLSESNAEGTDESSSEDEDVWPAAASNRSGRSVQASTEHDAAGPPIPRYTGPLIPRAGPVKLKSCKVGQVREGAAKPFPYKKRGAL